MGDDETIEHRAYARVGLLGNPSDGFYGKTIAFSISNFWASVKLRPSQELVFEPHPYHDHCQFSSLKQLVNRIEGEGYYGGIRLLMASCKVFWKFCSSHGIVLHDKNFTLSYDTNIPRQAGLSGSSAIVCASLNCLMKYYSVEQCIKMEDRPRIILSAENELGITAGLQDRVAQVYGGLVYMDFNKDHMVKTGNGIYTPMDPQLLPPLYIIFSENPSDSGKVHSTVKKRWLEGDEAVRSDMEKVAELAMRGCDALIKGDHSKLAQLMNQNFDLRRKIFGDEVLGELNIKMVETARSVGAACKFTGSGGAVVAFCPQGSEQVKQLEEACQRQGFTLQAAQVAQSLWKP